VHYSGAAVAVAATMTFSLTAFGQTRRATAVFHEPAGEIVEAGAPPCTATFCKTIGKRYKNKGLLGITEFETNYPTCTFISAGTWKPGTNIQPIDPATGMPAGTVDVSQPPFTGPTPPGCDGSGGPYLYGPIHFEWTLHKNLTAVPNFGPTATFNSEWDTPDGVYMVPYSFQITVPVVRPASETTAFVDWAPGGLTNGRWKQTLHPPASDASFDFSGESVQEADAAGTHLDSCWFPASAFAKFDMITGGTWTVAANNKWKFDHVGWFHTAVTYYRLPHSGVPARAPCKARFPQQMTIKAPADTSYNNYAGINGLGGNIGLTTVTSIRAGSRMTKTWP
jgi:hypothetical protein